MDSDPQATRFRQPLGQPPQGLLAKLLTFVLGAALLVLAVTFSLVALAVVAVVGLAFWGWLHWKTRRLRQQMRAAAASEPQIIEGQFTRHDDLPSRQPLK